MRKFLKFEIQKNLMHSVIFVQKLQSMKRCDKLMKNCPENSNELNFSPKIQINQKKILQFIKKWELNCNEWKMSWINEWKNSKIFYLIVSIQPNSSNEWRNMNLSNIKRMRKFLKF